MTFTETYKTEKKFYRVVPESQVAHTHLIALGSLCISQEVCGGSGGEPNRRLGKKGTTKNEVCHFRL